MPLETGAFKYAVTTLFNSNEMKHMKKYAIVILAAMLFAGCGDDDSDPQSRVENVIPNNFTADMLYDYPDSEGLLAASQTTLVQSVLGVRDSKTSSGLALSVFPEEPGATRYVTVGSVMCNDKELSVQDRRVYAFEPSFTGMSGIDYSSGTVKWDVSGSEEMESFSHTAEGFPAEISFESNVREIDLSKNYTLEVSAVQNTDSLLYIVAADGDFVLKRTDASQTSVTFTADDFAPIKNSEKGLVQVTAFKLFPEEVNGKKLYFVNAMNLNSLIDFQ